MNAAAGMLVDNNPTGRTEATDDVNLKPSGRSSRAASALEIAPSSPATPLKSSRSRSFRDDLSQSLTNTRSQGDRAKGDKKKGKKSKCPGCSILSPAWEGIVLCFFGIPAMAISSYVVAVEVDGELRTRNWMDQYLDVAFWVCIVFLLARSVAGEGKCINVQIVLFLLFARLCVFGWLQSKCDGCEHFYGITPELWKTSLIGCLVWVGLVSVCRYALALEDMRRVGRRFVSQKKRRFIDAKIGVDLDLTYITPNLIAMGWPTEDYIEQQFRNPMDQVQKLLKTRHPNRHMVVNLCSERVYNKKAFEREYHSTRFPDHQVCPLWKVPVVCKTIVDFLQQHPENVAAVHCKAGKGRTGMIMACLLMHVKKAKRASEALAYYDRKRTYNGKGVTIPSQIRWVNHYEAIIREQGLRPLQWLQIVRVEVVPETEEPWRLQILNENSHVIFDSAVEGAHAPLLEGDVKFVAFLGKTKLWQTWIHTRYDPFRVANLASAQPMLMPGTEARCNKGHTMNFIQAYVGGVCDECGEVVQRGETIFECRTCEPIWWYCGQCHRSQVRVPPIKKLQKVASALNMMKKLAKDRSTGSIESSNNVDKQELQDNALISSHTTQPATVIWKTDKALDDDLPGWMCTMKKMGLDGPHKNKGDKFKYKLRDGFDDAEKVRGRAIVNSITEVRFVFADCTPEEIHEKKLEGERSRMEKDQNLRSDLRTVAVQGAGILKDLTAGMEIKDYDDLENDTDNEEFLTILFRGYLLRKLAPCSRPVRRLCELHTTGRLHIQGKTFFDTLVVNLSEAKQDRFIMPDPDSNNPGIWWVRNPRTAVWEWLQAEDEVGESQWHEAFTDMLRFSGSSVPLLGVSSSMPDLQDGIVFRGWFSQHIGDTDPERIAAVMADQWRVRLFLLLADGRLVSFSYRERTDVVICNLRAGKFEIKMVNTQLRGMPNMVVFMIPATGGGGEWNTLAARFEDFAVFETKCLALCEDLQATPIEQELMV